MLHHKIAVIILSILLVGLLAIPACGTARVKNDILHVALLFDSPVAGDSFSLSCLKGAEQAKAQYNIALTFSVAGSDTEAELLMGQLAKSRSHDLIICIGASQTDALSKIAPKYPGQKFALVDGNIAGLSNVSSLLTRDHESSFLVGALAALVSRTNHLGFIGGRDEPSIQRFLVGYRSGAQYITPDCQISVDFAGSWLNDGKTKLLAVQQILDGADVLFGPAGAGSLGVIEAAREQGFFAIGVDADQSPLAPETVLVSAVKNVNVSIYQTIRNLAEGRFASGIQSSGLKEGSVEAKINTSLKVITPAMQNQIEEIRQKIISDEISVPEK